MKNQVCKSNNVKIIKQQKHKYFIKNQHKIQKKKQKKYYSENIDFVREKVKDYYESNRPAVREKQGSYFREKSFVVNEARRKNFRKRKLENQNPEDQTNNRITKLCKLCWGGPTFVCVVCNRYLYRNGVKLFDSSKYNFDTDSVIHKVDTEGSWVF